MRNRWLFSSLTLLKLISSICLIFRTGRALSFSNEPYSRNDAGFSLSNYRRACALETSKSLDASRFHFQILFVDDDNVKGRIAEGLLARVAEHNDAMCVLFPSSATIEGCRNAPRDAAPSEAALNICANLGLCEIRSAMMGTSFDLSYLDEYDLVVVIDETIRSIILRSLPAEDQEYYRPRCRLLSEFLSPDFYNSILQLHDSDFSSDDNSQILEYLDPPLQQHVAPLIDLVVDRSSDIFSEISPKDRDWPIVEAGLVLATAGLARFTLGTMNAQQEAAFQSLLETNFRKEGDLNISWEKADAQLRRCSYSITGFFSPQQRRDRFEKHLVKLSARFLESEE